MKTNIVKNFLYEGLTFKIRGCAFRVYNQLGFGHKEQIYQKALEIEFKKTNLLYQREKSIAVLYENIKMGNYRPDFLVDEKVVVEIKALPLLPIYYRKQLLSYLKGTKYYLALIINFGQPNIDIKRVIWTPNQ